MGGTRFGMMMCCIGRRVRAYEYTLHVHFVQKMETHLYAMRALLHGNCVYGLVCTTELRLLEQHGHKRLTE